MRVQFKGDYEMRDGKTIVHDRRWYFPSVNAREDAQAFLDTQADPHVTLHRNVRSLPAYYPIVKKYHGWVLRATVSDEEQGAPRPRDTVSIFPSAELAQAAEAELYSFLRPAASTLAKTQAALASADRGWFAQPLEHIQTALGFPTEDLCLRTIARVSAAQAATPSCAQDQARSYDDALTQASDVMDRMLGMKTPFKVAAVTERSVRGVLVGRSSAHLAVLTDSDGTGAIIRRAPIAFPLSAQSNLERSPERTAAIYVEYHRHGGAVAWQNPTRAFQDVDRDLAAGPLLAQSALTAGDYASVIHYDLTPLGQDIEATVAATNETNVTALDRGMGLFLLPMKPGLAPGSSVQYGPSFSSNNRAMARTR